MFRTSSVGVVVLLLALFTARPTSAQCVGDCNGDGVVAINELVKGVQMALAQSTSGCAAMDMDSDGRVTIAELVTAVSAALAGCPNAPTPTPTVTPRSGFRVCGKAAERPVPDPPLARNVLFTLEPLGASVFSTSAGFFCFEDIPPGTYTISVREYVGAPSHCTEYGCWQDTAVTVTDTDVLNVFVQMLPLPTPTPGPTVTPGSGFRICGKAAERPVPDPPLARNVLFTLEPLGATVFSTSAGFFCFEAVPPGSYTISVREYVGAPSHCTEYGCWKATPVTVVASDVLNVFVVMVPMPTPTPS